jgi:hypothetical protein
VQVQKKYNDDSCTEDPKVFAAFRSKGVGKLSSKLEDNLLTGTPLEYPMNLLHRELTHKKISFNKDKRLWEEAYVGTRYLSGLYAELDFEKFEYAAIAAVIGCENIPEFVPQKVSESLGSWVRYEAYMEDTRRQMDKQYE